MKKIYLAVPYTGMISSSYQQVTQTAARILATNKNLNVFSPITHGHSLTEVSEDIETSWEYWEKIDRQFLDWCDEVWILVPEEGVFKIMNSKGVIAEMMYATENNKPIVMGVSHVLVQKAKDFEK